MKLMVVIIIGFAAVQGYAQTAVGAQRRPTLADIMTSADRAALETNFVGRSNGDDAQATMRMLALDLAPFVKTFNRDIVTYNYRTRDESSLPASGRIPVDDPQGVTSADSWRNAIINHSPQGSGMLGWGFYTATDPVSTQSYGDTPDSFVLTSLRYPRGSRMLDLRHGIGYYIPMSTTTRARLSALCPNYVARGLSVQIGGTTYEALRKSTVTYERACHDIFVGALRMLGIDGLIYDYSANRMEYCDDGLRTDAAFVTVDSELNDQTVDVYMGAALDANGNEIPASMSAQDRTRYARMVFASGGSQYTGGLISRLSVPNNTPAAADIARWRGELRSETFNCDSQYAQQDAPHYNPNQVYELLIREGLGGLDSTLRGRIEGCVGRRP